MALGGAADYASWSGERSELQAAADAAAIGATRELALPGRTTEQIKQFATAIANANLGESKHDVQSEPLAGNDGIRVTITRKATSRFLPMTAIDSPVLVVSATARTTSTRKLCILAMEPGQPEAIHLKSNAMVTGKDCLVQSNSANPRGIDTDSGIRISAALTCSSGGLSGAGQIFGQSLTDCPRIPDPLAQRAGPAVTGVCDKTNLRVELNNSAGSRHELKPGTYCGGLFIGANSFVRFAPGIYIIKDGELKFDSNADVIGKHVGFYLTGAKARLHFTSNSKVHIDAPRDGVMAGILFFGDRNHPTSSEHTITSNYATNMTGTIYLPRGQFTVDATNDVAQNSAYTVIIARRLLLTASPRLVLNANYHKTDVPVPEGIIGSEKVRLIR